MSDQAEPTGDDGPGQAPPTPGDPPGRLADRPLSVPHPERLAPGDPDYDLIVDAHARALASGDDTYVDPRTGLRVMTARYLARRGYCCGSGCRHCPYTP